MGLAIGIDLGTTNTVVGAVVNGVAVTLADEKGRRLIPSVVAFTPTGQVLVGEAARERRVTDPKNSIYSVKRLIGRPFGSPEVQSIAERFPFSVVRGDKDSSLVVAQGTSYALPEISAFVLRRAKKIAETALGQSVDRAVVTVPANFNDLQRAATKLAGKLAGLEVLRILNEPTAAALAYGQSIEDKQKVAVYDLGGGTFDITLLDLDGNVFEVLATAGDTSLGGDDVDSLIAERLSDQLVAQHGFDARRDPVAFGRLRLAAEVMKRDLSVEMVVEHEIRDVVLASNGARLDVVVRLTRMELEALALPLIDRTLEVTRQSLTTARLNPTDFQRIILVGGSTRMPLIAKRVGEFFAQPPSGRVNPDEVVALGAAIQAHALVRTRDEGTKPAKANVPREPAPAPDRARAAAPAAAPAPAPAARDHARTTQPSVDGGREISGSLASRTPNDTAVEAGGYRAHDAAEHIGTGAPRTALQAGMPARPAPVPPVPGSVTGGDRARAPVDYAASSPEATSTRPLGAPAAPERFLGNDSGASAFSGASLGSAIEPDLSLDLDGARWEAERERLRAQGGIVAKTHAALLVDVTPLSLLVETVGGFCDVLIIGNTPVPCDKTRVFRTAQDNQTRVSIRVAQGNSNRFDQNQYLGELELSGIRPGKRGEAAIGVTFELDADGILNVKARDRDSGIETRAQLRSFAALTDVSDVAAMMERQNRHQVM